MVVCTGAPQTEGGSFSLCLQVALCVLGPPTVQRQTEHKLPTAPWRHLSAAAPPPRQPECRRSSGANGISRSLWLKRKVLWLQADLDVCFDACEEAASQRSSSGQQKWSAEVSSHQWWILKQHNYFSGCITILQPTAEKIKVCVLWCSVVSNEWS